MTKIFKNIKKDYGAKKMIKKNNNNLGLIKVNSKSIFKNFNTKKDFSTNGV